MIRASLPLQLRPAPHCAGDALEPNGLIVYDQIAGCAASAAPWTREYIIGADK